MVSVAPAPLAEKDVTDMSDKTEEAWGEGPLCEPRPSVHSRLSRVSTPTNGKVLQKGAGLLAVVAKIPAVINAVPLSSYGAVMMLPGLVQTTSFCDWFHRLGEAYIRLCLNYIVQGFITANIYVMSQKQAESLASGPPECEKLEITLEVICLWLHVVACFTDINETWNLHELLWYQIPTSTSGCTEVFQYVEADGSLMMVSGGFSVLRKAMVTLLILVPKLVIALLVLVWGGMWIAASATNADCLLNALALTFVVGIDEMIFTFLAPARTRHILEALPTFQSAVETPLWRFYRHMGTLVRTVVSILTVLGLRYMTRHCGDPGLFDNL